LTPYACNQTCRSCIRLDLMMIIISNLFSVLALHGSVRHTMCVTRARPARAHAKGWVFLTRVPCKCHEPTHDVCALTSPAAQLVSQAPQEAPEQMRSQSDARTDSEYISCRFVSDSDSDPSSLMRTRCTGRPFYVGVESSSSRPS
jgi:hypothetical protein